MRAWGTVHDEGGGPPILGDHLFRDRAMAKGLALVDVEVSIAKDLLHTNLIGHFFIYSQTTCIGILVSIPG